MVVLLAGLVAAIGLQDWRRAHARRPLLQRVSHIAQTAAILDTVLRAKPDDVPTILRAVSGAYVRADILTFVPPQGRLTEAPHVADKVRSLMSTQAPGLRAYTDGVRHGLAYPGEGLEGVIRRAVLPLASGKFLIVGVIVFPTAYSMNVLGLPSGFWIGLLGFLVAALALLAALREIAPLRRLTEAVTRFDGQQPQSLLAGGDGGDDSELGRLVRAVGEMQERIATLLRERSFLIGAISHDAKTYLTRLRLRSEEVEDAGRRAGLIRNIDAIAELLDTSLAYARGTTTAPRRDQLDLADLAAIEIAEREAVGERRIVACTFADAAIVEGDPVALKRVAANLIDNAAKFGRERIEVEVSRDGDCSLLRVGDDGPGIPEAERDLVFSPFYRLEKSRSRQTGGTGLGLAIARQIVEAHGGTIAVERSPLGGALLVVRLPTARAHHAHSKSNDRQSLSFRGEPTARTRNPGAAALTQVEAGDPWVPGSATPPRNDRD